MSTAVRINPWTLGVIGVAAFATACVTSTPMRNGGMRVGIPGPYAAQDGRGEALSGPPRVIPAPPMSCVPFARARSGINVQGDAHLWWNAAAAAGYHGSSRPEPGGVIVIRIGQSGERGHVAFVKRVSASREIYVDHANWHGRNEVAVDVPIIDVSPNNDWSQVRVFWVDSGQMGARTYSVEGFIGPPGRIPGA
jgi:hypothetical protein